MSTVGCITTAVSSCYSACETMCAWQITVLLSGGVQSIWRQRKFIRENENISVGDVDEPASV